MQVIYLNVFRIEGEIRYIKRRITLEHEKLRKQALLRNMVCITIRARSPSLDSKLSLGMQY